jgi:hypothetical protein
VYTLKKWYFDFLTPDREYVFVYFAYVKVLGQIKGSLTIHCARPGKGSPLTRSFAVNHPIEWTDECSRHFIQLPGGEIVIAEDQCSISFERGDCSVNLRYVSLGESRLDPVVINTGGKSRILWKPIGLRYQVSGRITLGGVAIPVEDSNGYVDYLESSYLPFVVPVRTLYWGRLHDTDIDAVYIHAADFHKEHTWSKLYVRNGGVMTDINRLSILDSGKPGHDGSASSCPDVYEVVGESNAVRIRMTVRHALPVQESAFIDQQEIKSSLARFLLKLLTRNPRSTKFLSHADIVLESERKCTTKRQIPMIDEYALL